MSELSDKIDELAAQSPGSRTAEGEGLFVLLQRLEASEGISAAVERYKGSPNDAFHASLAAIIGDKATEYSLAEEDSNLIYELIAGLPIYEERTLTNCLNAIYSQAVGGVAWTPAEQTPPGLGSFLVRCLAFDWKDSHHLDTTIGTIWAIHNWAHDRGGLSSVFGPEERDKIRVQVTELGIEEQAKPLLDALGG